MANIAITLGSNFGNFHLSSFISICLYMSLCLSLSLSLSVCLCLSLSLSVSLSLPYRAQFSQAVKIASVKKYKIWDLKLNIYHISYTYQKLRGGGGLRQNFQFFIFFGWAVTCSARVAAATPPSYALVTYYHTLVKNILFLSS